MPQPIGRRTGGITGVTIDGSSYMLCDDAVNWSASAVSRETVIGLDGVHGFKEKPVAGYVEFTIRDIGLRVEDFNAMRSSTVVISQGNDKTVVLSNGWCTSALEVNGVEGTFTVRFEGPDVVELF